MSRKPTTDPSERSVITPVKDAPPGFETAGYGRIVRFAAPQTLGTIIQRISDHLGLPALSVAIPQSMEARKRSEIKISSIGICAGSGGSLLNGLDVDLLFTGELSHHEALAATEQGRCVITTFHSNSERRYLRDRMVQMLYSVLKDATKTYPYEIQVDVSRADRDPYEIVIVSGGT